MGNFEAGGGYEPYLDPEDLDRSQRYLDAHWADMEAADTEFNDQPVALDDFFLDHGYFGFDELIDQKYQQCLDFLASYQTGEFGPEEEYYFEDVSRLATAVAILSKILKEQRCSGYGAESARSAIDCIVKLSAKRLPIAMRVYRFFAIGSELFEADLANSLRNDVTGF